MDSTSKRLAKIPNDQLDEPLKAAEKARNELEGRFKELEEQLVTEGVHLGETRESMLRRKPIYQEVVNILQGMNDRERLLIDLYSCLRKYIEKKGLDCMGLLPSLCDDTIPLNPEISSLLMLCDWLFCDEGYDDDLPF